MWSSASMMECAIFVLLCVIGSVLCVKPQLRPSHDTVERSQNGSYVVFCIAGTEEVTWSSPWGKITANKGRIHVEQKPPLGLALMFDPIEVPDKGKYTCTSASKETSSFELTVIRKSQFKNTPAQHSVNEFQNTFIRCEVEGEPKPLITWQRDGVSINSTMIAKYVPEAKGLKVINATKGDSGVFTCRALQVGRDDGYIETIEITLRVNHKPEWKELVTGNVMAFGYVGGETNLTCEASAQPEANYTWYRNGKEVKIQKLNISEILVQDRSVLQIFIQDEALYGQYQCQARNKLGMISRVFELSKGMKPDPPTGLRVVDTTVHDAKLKIASEVPDLVGYRVQFVISRPGQEVSWDKPEFQDLTKGEDGYYWMKDLLEDTPYTVRVASRSPAGLSDYYETTVLLRTLRTTSGTSSSLREDCNYVIVVLAMLMSTVH